MTVSENAFVTPKESVSFSPISLDMQEKYLQYLAACPQKASDYSFVNIWAWGEEYGLECFFGPTYAWIRQTRPQLIYWAPVGPWDTTDWTRSPYVREFSRYTRVPEQLLSIWEKAFAQQCSASEERGNFDYLYSVQELSELRGNRFHKKKNLLKQFQKKHDFVYRCITSDCVEAAISMQKEWFGWRDQQSQEVLAGENRAIMRILTNWDILGGMFGAVIEVEGKQAAYTVGEALDEKTLVIHLEKGHTQYKGIYQAINQMFLAHDASAYDVVNREQDLNDEGLRKAKESYHPIQYLKKYSVTLA